MNVPVLIAVVTAGVLTARTPAHIASIVTLEAPEWLVAFLDGLSVWDLVVAIAAVGSVIWFIRKRGWQSVKAFAHGILHLAEILESVRELPAFQKRIEEKVDDIYHMTHNNNGTSIKDSADRTEAAVGVLDAKVETLTTGLVDVHTSLAGVHGRLDTVESGVNQLTKSDEDQWAAIEKTLPPTTPKEE